MATRIRIRTILAATSGYRPMTHSEIEDWYARMNHLYGPHDSAGESWVCSGNTHVDLDAGTKVELLRARCSARVGWRSVSGFAEVRLPDGVVCKVKRDLLAV